MATNSPPPLSTVTLPQLRMLLQSTHEGRHGAEAPAAPGERFAKSQLQRTLTAHIMGCWAKHKGALAHISLKRRCSARKKNKKSTRVSFAPCLCNLPATHSWGEALLVAFSLSLHICLQECHSLRISPCGCGIGQDKLITTVEKTKKAEVLIKVDTPKRFREYDERLKEIVWKHDESNSRLEAHIMKLKGLLEGNKQVRALFSCTWSCSQSTTHCLRPVDCLYAGHAG